SRCRFDKVEGYSTFVLKWSIWNAVPVIIYMIWANLTIEYFWVFRWWEQLIMAFGFYVALLGVTLCTLPVVLVLTRKGYDFHIYGWRDVVMYLVLIIIWWVCIAMLYVGHLFITY
ncbi:hypothetical protein KC909_05090, partial [Candidatus Dojkabacteria bacterium]|nr:hypothetical protein [Candidatus Dojkabacteria bacterium]